MKKNSNPSYSIGIMGFTLSLLLTSSLLLTGCVTTPSAASPMTDEQRTQQQDAVFNRLWNQSLPEMEEALSLKERMETAPDHAFFTKDKRSLKEDFNDILDGLSIILSDRSLSELQEERADLKQKIQGRQSDIAEYKENRLGAPLEDLIKTTKEGYDKKITSAEEDIRIWETHLEGLKVAFSQELDRYGIHITPEQADVLLTRVDADDILHMTMVFDSVKGITAKLMELTSHSGEDIQFAKKYYGLHVVLVELIVHIQDRYLAQVQDRYLPRLGEIMKRTHEVSLEAQQELRREKDANRRKIYENNLQAHDLTMKTAKLYAKTLGQQEEKIRTARQKALRDLAVARNTMKTVMISADLLGLLQSSQKTFKALLNLQLPELIPFQNLAMRKKFEELSMLLAE